MPRRIPIDRLRAELSRRSLSTFVRQFWHVLEPHTELVWSWHLDAICSHLEAVSAGAIKRLIINVPPGHMKSLLVSVFWPAWHWAVINPGWRVLSASYAADLATRDAVKTRTLIESEEFQASFPNVQMKSDQNRKDYFENTSGGVRQALGVGGKATGYRGDVVIVDDPHNATEAQSELHRKTVKRWWDQAMSSRLNDQRTGARVIIMQRLHEEDLTGHALKKGGYEHLCLPSEFEPLRKCATSIWSDPRVLPGELLAPERFPSSVIDAAKIELGSYGYAGQHQQRPAPDDGGMFRRAWFKRYAVLPPRLDEWIATVDCAFKDTTKADFVVCQVWARSRAERYLVKSYRARLTFSNTCALLRRMKAEFPQVGAILVEDKANGTAVIDTLRGEVSGVIAWDPGSRSKQERASTVVPIVEAGQVFLPEKADWEGPPGDPVEAFLLELCVFPNGANDDQVDALTMALTRWRMPTVGSKVMPLPAKRVNKGLDF